MTAIFHNMIHKDMEVYMDDLLEKSLTLEGHLHALQRVLERSRKYKLRMNPKKCVFGVSSKKLLGFIVNHRGIEINLVKVKAIVEMPPLKDRKQL